MTWFFGKIIGAVLRINNKLFRKYPAINIVEKLTTANKVLIYMPEQVEHFGAALKALEKLRKLRPHWKITVVTKLEMVTFLDNRLKLDILPYSPQDVNIFGLPRNNLKQLIQSSTFDLALDFKLTFDILSIQIFKLSGAPIKVCLNSQEKSPFYNFEIRVNPAESLANKYSAMIRYISIMAESKTPEESPQSPKLK